MPLLSSRSHFTGPSYNDYEMKEKGPMGRADMKRAEKRQRKSIRKFLKIRDAEKRLLVFFLILLPILPECLFSSLTFFLNFFQFLYRITSQFSSFLTFFPKFIFSITDYFFFVCSKLRRELLHKNTIESEKRGPTEKLPSESTSLNQN